MSQSVFTQGSVSLTTTPEYLPVSGFNTLSLHLSQSPRLHPSQISQTNCNNPSNVSHTWPACDNTQLSKSRSKHENKLTAKFPVSFQVQFKTVSTSYTTQVVSIDLQYYMFNSNTSTTATQTDIRGYLMHLRNQNQRSQTGKQSSLWPCLLTVRCQPTISTPSSTVPSVPWRFLSLSLSTPVPTLPGKSSCFRLQSQGHQSVQTSVKPHCSCTLPNLRCSTTHVLSQKCVATKPRSLTKQIRPSRFSCQRFSNVATKPRSPTLQALMPTTISNVATKPRSPTLQALMPTTISNVATKPRSPTLQVLMPTFLFLTIISRHDARLSSTTHCALRASRINYNLTNLSRCNSFS